MFKRIKGLFEKKPKHAVITEYTGEGHVAFIQDVELVNTKLYMKLYKDGVQICLKKD